MYFIGLVLVAVCWRWLAANCPYITNLRFIPFVVVCVAVFGIVQKLHNLLNLFFRGCAGNYHSTRLV